jgi:hypothetical protein
LDRTIEILSRHSKKAEDKLLKKSTTKLEGASSLSPSLHDSFELLTFPSTVFCEQFLPIEGDVVYRGAKQRMEEIREFNVRRQGDGSTYSGAGSDRGD